MSAVAPSEFQKWFDAGVKESESFQESWRRARAHAINAGFYFIKAKSLCPGGEWVTFLDRSRNRIKPRTVQFYMQFAEAAVAWVQAAFPGLPPAKMQAKAASEIMLMSPKPLVALLRDLRELRPFGEYDAVKYATKKNGSGQIEFAFDSVFAPLDALAHFGDPKYQFVFPEGKDESTCIAEVKAKLQAALKRVEEIEQNGRVIET